MKDVFYTQSWLNLVQFLQFPDCKNWMEIFLAENIDLATSNFTRIEDDFKYQFIGFCGISVSLLNEKIYKTKIEPLQMQNLKSPIKLLDISGDWIDAIESMNFYDFMFFLKEKEASSSRLFDLSSINQEPIIKISNSGMIIQFSENDPNKFDSIFLHFNSNNSPQNLKGIPIT